MPIDRRKFLAASVTSLAAMATPTAAVQALEGPVFFAKDSLLPSWLNQSENPAWFGVDVMVSPREPNEVASIWVREYVGECSGYGTEFLTTMTTRQIAAYREEPLAIYTVAPVRPLMRGECMAYVGENAFPLDKYTLNAIWTGSPADYWLGRRPGWGYQLNDGRRFEGVREFVWIA